MKLIRHFLLCLIILTSSGQLYAQAAGRYQLAWENAAWALESTQTHCKLTQDLPRLGKAEFIMGRDQTLWFSLLVDKKSPSESIALVQTIAPEWSHSSEGEQLSEVLIEADNQAISLSESLSQRMFQELENGMIVAFYFTDWSDGKQISEAQLTPIGFKLKVAAFKQCVTELPPPPLPEIPPEYMLHFSTDRSELTQDALLIIEQICQTYASRKEAVKHIKISAHADERGTDEYNQKLSEKRARIVESQLKACNVPGEKLTVEHFGEARPVVKSADEKAWRKNRRVKVVLELNNPP